MKTKSASVRYDVNGCECRMGIGREKHSLAITKSIIHLCFKYCPINEGQQELFPFERDQVYTH